MKKDDLMQAIANSSLNMSIDCSIFTVKEDKLQVLLTKLIPGMDWMLPGGFVLNNESADVAAIRILKQRTGLDHIYLQQFKTFTDPNRFSFKSLVEQLGSEPDIQSRIQPLPDRVISIGYFALVNYKSIHPTGGEFEEDSMWCDVSALPLLMFDHALIIQEAKLSLQRELFYKPIGYNLLPKKFTMPELQKIYEIILDRTLERSSFQKKMLKSGIYDRLEERREGVAHKRPFLYSYNTSKYLEAEKKGIKFNI